MSILSFNFVANVDSSVDSTILAGDQIKGLITYNTTQLGFNGVYTFTGSSKIHDFNFKAYRNGQQIASDQYNNNQSYQIFVGNSVIIKGLSVAGRNFNLVLTGPKALPTPTNINSFNISNCNANFT